MFTLISSAAVAINLNYSFNLNNFFSDDVSLLSDERPHMLFLLGIKSGII